MNESEPQSVALLEQLIAFDTTSRNSNLNLIHFVRDYLSDLGVACELVFDETGEKANLYATFGPGDRGGIALSGHTDVVPVDGQNWETDPFALVRKGSRLYARGTSDMKSFIAVCLTFAPEILKRDLQVPIHFVFSYDEEIGCVGVRRLITMLEDMAHRPIGVVIGEPTSMKVARAHKGKLSMRCQVRGLEGHSGLTHLGVNAVEAAAETIAYLKGMARRQRDTGPFDPELKPSYTTIHTGVVQGGTQLNIIPKSCWFDFEFRHLPEVDPEELLGEVKRYVETSLLPEMHEVSPDTGFDWEPGPRAPGLNTDRDAEIVRLAQMLTGANTSGKISFGTEGGLFSDAGMPSVVCGPGSIEQAHKPNEWIELDQISQCEQFVQRLIDHLSESSEAL